MAPSKPNFAALKASDAQMLCLAEASGYKNPALPHNQDGEEVITGTDPTNGQTSNGAISRGPDPSVQGPYGSVTVSSDAARISVSASDPNTFGPSFDLTIDAKTGARVAAHGLSGNGNTDQIEITMGQQTINSDTGVRTADKSTKVAITNTEKIATAMAQRARSCFKP